MKKTKFNTDAIRAGNIRTAEGEHSEALFLTSSFVFKNAKEAADRFSSPRRVMSTLDLQIHQ